MDRMFLLVKKIYNVEKSIPVDSNFTRPQTGDDAFQEKYTHPQVPKEETNCITAGSMKDETRKLLLCFLVV